jgi:hypothetical protein
MPSGQGAVQYQKRPGLGFDPLVGTWNFNGAGFQGTVSFNAGGTSVELDTPSRSPQVTPNGIAEDTISLGPWVRTGTSTYLWKTQNFAFPNGNVVVAKTSSTLTLMSSDSFTATGEAQFFDLNGNLLASSPVTFSGTRFAAQ